MPKSSKVTDELELTEGLGSLAQAYEEISVMKMQEVRGTVLANRIFLTDLAQVFANVKSSYKHQVEEIAQKLKKQESSFSNSTLAKNGKKAVVLLTANNKLYGEIIPKTFKAFMEEVAKADADIMLIGLLGKELFDQKHLQRPYAFHALPDANIAPDDLKAIIQELIAYDSVKVFYGKFENVISQIPQVTLVSGDTAVETQNPTEDLKFFFEPSLENILNFFETQIFSSLFKQTVHENQLARYASRINAMEAALQNIHSRIGHLQHDQKRANNILQNKKQLSVLAGISLWNTDNKKAVRKR